MASDMIAFSEQQAMHFNVGPSLSRRQAIAHAPTCGSFYRISSQHVCVTVCHAQYTEYEIRNKKVLGHDYVCTYIYQHIQYKVKFKNIVL